MPWDWIAAWLIAVNVWAVVLTASDKRRAKQGRHRTPESTLFLVAVLGGAAGMYLTMQAVRHKTKHRRFMWGLPLIILLQVVCLVYFASLFLR
ncbi:MAG: DUF1294 domain-containing protein [Clostridia bacterium]|nr:DUF1294 domain-containing protein [Clostridia bacterium]